MSSKNKKVEAFKAVLKSRFLKIGSLVISSAFVYFQVYKPHADNKRRATIQEYADMLFENETKGKSIDIKNT